MKTLIVQPFSCLQRIYPLTALPAGGSRPAAAALDLGLNQRGSFQIALRHEEARRSAIRLEARPSDAFDFRIRRVGYVPVRHHSDGIPLEPDELDGIGMIPGFAPDPLFDETTISLAPRETHAFWITVTPRRHAVPGRHTVSIDIVPEHGRRHACRIALHLHPVKIRTRRNFVVFQWFYVDALLDAYKCPSFNARFWKVLEAYFRNLSEHGQNAVYAPVFTPPLDGVKRPSQLLHVTRRGKNDYNFDWRDVKRYVDLARRSGLTHFGWTHFFSQWGVKHAIRIYEGQGLDEKRLWPPSTSATSPVYRAFLAKFLPEFHVFLQREKLLGNSLFHVSDEPHGEEHRRNYSRARALLAELAPWMKVSDALSEVEFGREKLTDMPLASIETALEFIREGIDCGCYFCCGPRGRFLNRLIDTPLPKIAAAGWLFYRWPFKSFLHWGYNYWYRQHTRELIDPYQINDAHSLVPGDPFVVYPGPDGPVDSLRWEVFAESLRDYALLQSLKVSPDDPLLSPLRSFQEFPKTPDWVPQTRRRLLRMGASQ